MAERRKKRFTALRGPRTITLVDQVFSSVSNVLAVLLVAHAVNKDDFGRFALGYAILTLTLTLSRSYFGTRVSLAPDKLIARELTAAIVGTLVMISPLVFVAVLVASIATAGTHALLLLLIVALATPVVLVQDIIRAGSAASNQPWAALLSDFVWVAIMAAPFVLGLKLSSTAAMGLWGLAAAAALVVALFTYRILPNFGDGKIELRTRDAMGESVTIGAIVVNVSTLILLAVVSHSLGPADAGSLRGAATLMGPVNVLINFAGLGLTPALVRRPRSQDKRFCATTAVAIASMTAVWGFLLLVMPQRYGVKLFHDSWPGIRHVLPFTLTEYLLTCMTTAALLGLKVRNEPKVLRSLRITSASITLVGGSLVCFLIGDVRAVSTVLAVSSGAAGLLGWRGFLRSKIPPRTAQPTLDVLPSDVVMQSELA